MRIALVLVVAGAVLAAPQVASACTIAARPIEERLADADVAVWGRVVSRVKLEQDERPDGVRGDAYRYRFRVREIYKGRVRNVIRLVAHTDGGTCGVGPYEPGRRLALLLRGRRGPWNVDLASLVTRRELRSVRRPRRV